jgi:hypothetical protein
MKRLCVVAMIAGAGCATDPVAAQQIPIAADRASAHVAAGSPAAVGGTWAPLTNRAPAGVGLSLLSPDGTVIAQEVSTERWWRLTPDEQGHYASGKWSKLASMPTGYSPLYYASGWLPDGRLVVMGGEYLADKSTWTTKGAIYDPLANTWNALKAPTGWTSVGDAQSTILADGTFMLADCCTRKEALLDPQNLTWTATGTGKADSNDEEGWTLLPNGKLFTVDANNTTNTKGAEIYDPTAGSWSATADAPVQIADITSTGAGSHEVGPAPLRSDGTLFVIGATGHNAVYDWQANSWQAAPDLPVIGGKPLVSEDGPAVLLPNGNVLFAASPKDYKAPTYYFEWDGTAISRVPAPPNAPNDASYQINLLVLPTGEILTTEQTQDVEIYTPTVGPDLTLAPVIETIPQETSLAGTARLPVPTEQPLELVPLTTLYAGRTYTVSAKRPNGVTQGSFYGDDAQASTNYPIVELANVASGHVRFARTHSGSTYAIGADVTGTFAFDVPSSAEGGLTRMIVVANGIASPAVTVEVK